jgi:hypothetical protein
MAGQEAIWHVMIGGKEQGPLTKAQVLEYLTHGMLAGSDLIWRPGFPDWKPVSELGEFWLPPKRTTVQLTPVQSRKVERMECRHCRTSRECLFATN